MRVCRVLACTPVGPGADRGRSFGGHDFLLPPTRARNIVTVAGIYGTATATRRIFFVQVVPAALALVFVLLAA